MKKTDYAWAAGFIDGEGCFVRTNGRLPKLQISQVDPMVLFKLMRILGGTVRGPYQHKTNPNARPIYRYSISGQALYQHMPMLEKYLGDIKRAQYNAKIR